MWPLVLTLFFLLVLLSIQSNFYFIVSISKRYQTAKWWIDTTTTLYIIAQDVFPIEILSRCFWTASSPFVIPSSKFEMPLVLHAPLVAVTIIGLHWCTLFLWLSSILISVPQQNWRGKIQSTPWVFVHAYECCDLQVISSMTRISMLIPNQRSMKENNKDLSERMSSSWFWFAPTSSYYLIFFWCYWHGRCANIVAFLYLLVADSTKWSIVHWFRLNRVITILVAYYLPRYMYYKMNQ